MINKSFVFLFVFLLGITTINAQNWSEKNKVVAFDRAVGDQFGYSVAISGNYAVVGVPYEDEDASGNNTTSNAGSAYIYKNNGGVWEQVQKIVPSVRATGDWFGMYVAIEGNIIIVGAEGEDEDASGLNNISAAGAAYIFTNNNGIWQETQKIVASDRSAGAYFGYSVAISGDNIIVGAWYDDYDKTGGNLLSNSGSAYIFHNNNGTWEQVIKLVAMDRAANDQFGISVDISGDYAIVSSWLNDLNETGTNAIADAGAVYMFKNNNGIWSQIQKVVAPERTASDKFGNSIAISGEFAFIGAFNEDEDAIESNTLNNAGSVYIFKNTNDIWSQYQKIAASSRALVDLFGVSVSVSSDYLFVGAYNDDDDAQNGNPMPDAGSAYMFKKIGNYWQQVQKLVASDRGAADGMGWAVSISDDYSIAVAMNEDEDVNGANTLTSAGAAYIFANWPEITSQPLSQSEICVGESIQFSASGNNISSYQWQVNTGTGFTDIANGGPYSNSTTSILNVTVTSAMNHYSFRCILLNTVDTITSHEATLTIDSEQPEITSTHPNQSLFAGPTCNTVLPNYTPFVHAIDNCDLNPVITQFPAAGSTISGNSNNVTITVTDNAGNFSQTSFIVNVLDITNPVFTSTHTDQTVFSGSTCEAILLDYTTTATGTDNCDNHLLVTQSPASGTTISGTTNVVTLTMTDDAGNYAQTSFNVSVADNTNPVFSSTHTDLTVFSGSTCEAVLLDYTATATGTDNCDNDLAVTQSPAAGTTISGITNVVTLTITDDAGNFAQTSFNVNVADNTNPVITSTHADQTLFAGSTCEAVLLDYTSTATGTDNCDNDLAVSQSPAAGTIISGTTNVVTLTLTDDAGNYAQTSFNVSVQDNTNPVITSSHPNQSLSVVLTCDTVLPDYTLNLTATDNCDNTLTKTQSPVAGTIISGMSNIVILTVTDDAGNYAQTPFVVSVADHINPVITCPEDQTIDLLSGQSEYNVQGAEFDPVSNSDNCDVANIENNFNQSATLDAAVFPIGTTEVTWIVSDNSGNLQECIFSITINPYVGSALYQTSSIQIYPNPAKNKLNISGLENNSYRVIISDIIGNTLINNALVSNNEIDISELAAGIYSICILSDEISSTYKFIKEE